MCTKHLNYLVKPEVTSKYHPDQLLLSQSLYHRQCLVSVLSFASHSVILLQLVQYNLSWVTTSSSQSKRSFKTGGLLKQVRGKPGQSYMYLWLYVWDNVHTCMMTHVHTCIVLILLAFGFHYIYSVLETQLKWKKYNLIVYLTIITC